VNAVASATPRTDLLYFPIPPHFTGMKQIYALMDSADKQSTVIFGVDPTDPSWIYMTLQSPTDRHLAYKCDGWNRILRVKDGTSRFPAFQARALWEERVVKRGWRVIPNQG
jgi:hypothetical protein